MHNAVKGLWGVVGAGFLAFYVMLKLDKGADKSMNQGSFHMHRQLERSESIISATAKTWHGR